MYNKYINELLSDKIVYAHTKYKSGNVIKEPLLSHMKLTINYYFQMESYKNIEGTVINLLNSITRKNNIEKETVMKAYEYFKGAIYYHDIGKLNPNFQMENMDNNIGKIDNIGTEHSIISAYIYLDLYKKEILDEVQSKAITEKDATFLIYIIFYFSYIISRHHSKLTNLDDYISKLSNLDLSKIYISNLVICEDKGHYTYPNLKKFIDIFEIDEISLYILNELLYSCLVTADFLATTEFMTDEKINLKRDKNLELFKKYEDSELFKTINLYNEGKVELDGINKLRSDMYLEASKNLLNNLDYNIYYLEAPTGSGKTNMAINLSRILYKNISSITSINYIFPFNTLIDQTKNTLSNYFMEYNDFIVINSCTSMVDEKEEVLNYEMAYIKSEFRLYDIKLTSHVNLFDILFGTSKSSKYNLYDLVNSVVVLDEIQAYSNVIWRDMINLIEKFSKLLNIKFIIMSATLPKLDYLLDDKKESIKVFSLIKEKEKFFNNKLFKDRVNLDFSMLEKGKINEEELLNKILKYKDRKVLVEFITKKTSGKFFNKLKEMNVDNVYELTGDDNEFTRNLIIERTKEDKPLILIATQTIEAGVDIDMDIGFKDISFMDNEEQFIGRINRSSKKNGCIAYFFDLDDEAKIYRNDMRCDFTIRNNEIRDLIKSKDFENYYHKVMEKVHKYTDKYNDNNITNLYDYCGNLNFCKISERLKLIDNNTIQIFLNYTIEINGEKIVGEKIWEKYKQICMGNDISYARKQIELSKIKSRLNLFIYTLYKEKSSGTKYYDEEFGGIYYIQNGSQFITDGKFNREKYINYTGGIFV